MLSPLILPVFSKVLYFQSPVPFIAYLPAPSPNSVRRSADDVTPRYFLSYSAILQVPTTIDYDRTILSASPASDLERTSA